MKLLAVFVCVVLMPLIGSSFAQGVAIEIHDRIKVSAQGSKRIALTLDACSGDFDDDLIQFLIRNRISATVFLTKKWMAKNAYGVNVLKTNQDIFELEDHGENHVPAVLGKGRKVYGIPGEPDLLHLRKEVLEGARAIESVTGAHPHWYRSATAVYDYQAAQEIRNMGFQIAGFSVNADAGATLRKAQILERLRAIKEGDIVIAHMNKPKGDTAEALSVGLIELLKKGFVFVRLNDVDIVQLNAPRAP
jgi:peptidoglycan/xylan/chitin deacetylase (PgdA/CDA1 family)